MGHNGACLKAWVEGASDQDLQLAEVSSVPQEVCDHWFADCPFKFSCRNGHSPRELSKDVKEPVGETVAEVQEESKRSKQDAPAPGTTRRQVSFSSPPEKPAAKVGQSNNKKQAGSNLLRTCSSAAFVVFKEVPGIFHPALARQLATKYEIQPDLFRVFENSTAIGVWLTRLLPRAARIVLHVAPLVQHGEPHRRCF